MSSTPETKPDSEVSESIQAPAAADTTIEAYGSCLCRAIIFTLTGAPLNTVLCHCSNCGHASGVGFMANSFYAADQLQIKSQPSSTLKTYIDTNTDSGAVLQRQFCGDCGSPLFTRNEKMEGFVVVCSGALEREMGREWKPAMELWCKGRRGWVPEIEGTKMFEEMF
ncbi:uncharacterized protein CC84DRAFT_1261312 [Paraphaeosphaeria sporulosa]|uniref:CENP-V/GFA domain-containing protein n=1 Tax=Paraphaeosphaeria sporulosa TaxID=1460663 RepID=A0A177C7A3_9PLEO|nr:uncharacterized protein CC84DRAFT_1261312 [Paraphaeosphaeria sporulosa]OAG02580.1 hypothetical protein CC84DRAFT_1261312 [Paraphaeosphaeria sporulosa]